MVCRGPPAWLQRRTDNDTDRLRGRFMSEEHENFIKTPKQLIIVVALAFVVPVIGILMLSQLMTTDKKFRIGESPVMVAERLKPIGEVAVAGPKVLLAGDKLYDSLCKTCHEG